jgi:hypothetical protein
MPNATQIENLKYLCEKILEPLRRNFGVIKLIAVSAALYSTRELMELETHSIYGQAADIRCISKYIARKYFDFHR